MQRSAFLALAAPAGASTWVTGNAILGAAARIEEIERRSGGRLGIYATDTASHRYFGHRDTERFPMCSTFKLLAVAAVLARVDAGLERRVAFTRADLLAPITQQHVATGSMTLTQLCAAAIEWSDNTAANLVLRTLGGPSGVTRYARSLDDVHTRLDRSEPALNSALPGDARDTTTPRAMADNVRLLLTRNALSISSRTMLTTWLLAAKTGLERLRAGVPADWRAGDKTGSGDHGTSNDVAIFWPPGHASIVAAVYLTQSTGTSDERDALLANIGQLIATAFAARYAI